MKMIKSKKEIPGIAIYMDCNDKFESEKMIPILKKYDLDSDTIMDNIVFTKVNNMDQLTNALLKVEDIMLSRHFNLTIVSPDPGFPVAFAIKNIFFSQTPSVQNDRLVGGSG